MWKFKSVFETISDKFFASFAAVVKHILQFFVEREKIVDTLNWNCHNFARKKSQDNPTELILYREASAFATRSFWKYFYAR